MNLFMRIILKLVFDNKTGSFRLETSTVSDEKVGLKASKLFSGSINCGIFFRYLEQVYRADFFFF
jgi:hypothetical protein